MLSFFHAPHCTTSTMTSVQEGGSMEERGKKTIFEFDACGHL